MALHDKQPFTPIIEPLARERGLVTAAVFGIVQRHCQRDDGVCSASLETMAEMIGTDRTTILRHIKKLCEDGYLKDLTPDLRNSPHIYEDTGKVDLMAQIDNASDNSVAIRNSSNNASDNSVAYSNSSMQTVAHSNTLGDASDNSVAESHLKKDSSTTTKTEGLKQIGDLCKEYFFDPAIDPYRTDLIETITKYSAVKVLWAIQTALSPDRQNGKAKSWGYVLGILEKDERRLKNQGSLRSRPGSRDRSPPARSLDPEKEEIYQELLAARQKE